MTDEYEPLVDEYAKKFPGISREDHLMIVRGALGGDDSAMSEEGFRKWYDNAGVKLERDRELIEMIRENPHFVMYRETMILGGDWAFAEPIFDVAKARAEVAEEREEIR